MNNSWFAIVSFRLACRICCILMIGCCLGKVSFVKEVFDLNEFPWLYGGKIIKSELDTLLSQVHNSTFSKDADEVAVCEMHHLHFLEKSMAVQAQTPVVQLNPA